MKKTITFLIIALGSCATVQKPDNREHTIVGTWCLTTNEINYPTLFFSPDSSASFGSKMDTVYTFKYYVQGDYLNIVLPTNKVNKDHIIKLTADSLILETLLENKTKQVYYRCKK